MGKGIVVFCIFALFCVPQLFSGGIGIGSDSIELPPQELTLPAENTRNRAIGFYIAALLENSNLEKKADLLLKAAALEPENRLIMLVLIKTADRVPSRQKQIRAFLEQISQKFPANVFLAYQSCQMDAKLNFPPEKIISKAFPVLKNTVPQKNEWRYFYMLAAQYLDLLLISDTPAQMLPFNAEKRVGMLELAILYYSSCRHKDMLLDRDFSLAQTQLDKHLKLLEQFRFKNFADVRRMAAALNTVHAPGSAFRIVRAWNEKNFTPESALLLIETAARAGEEKTLDLLLKKYPALDVDFCIRMRCFSLVRNGKYDQAAKMAENFQNPADRIQNLKWIALLKKDVKTLEKIIDREQKKLRNDRRQIINMLLSLAEMSRELRFFKQAENLVPNAIITKDHTLANSFGYVAAVLEHNLDQAQKRIAFALRSQPDNPAYLDSMAWVCFKKGNFAEAEKYLQKALKKADFSMSSAVLADHAGDIYFALMQKAKALRYYRTAQRLYQENPAENADLDFEALNLKIKNRFPEKLK